MRVKYIQVPGREKAPDKNFVEASKVALKTEEGSTREVITTAPFRAQSLNFSLGALVLPDVNF